jgi:hypothetical protein
MDENRWDAALLHPIAELNEQLLEILRAAASSPEECSRLVSTQRGLWRALDDTARQRLARCPYLLLDAGFACRERWDPLALPSGVMDGCMPRGYFASPAGIALVRRTLVFGWHLARSNRLTARVLLGMHADCAERIAQSPLRDLEALAELSPAWVTPRWEAQPLIWRQLLEAALSGRDGVLRQVQLRGLQLLAAAS